MFWSKTLAIFCVGGLLALNEEPGNQTKSLNTSLLENIGALSRRKCLEYYPQPSGPEVAEDTEPSWEYPHMAALGMVWTSDDNVTSIKWMCGGSLISFQFVLTSAHCLRTKILTVVRLGDLDLERDTDDAEPQTFKIKRNILHPEYEYPKKYHDIGLIELEKPIKRTIYVTPACLHTEKTIPQTMMITGWGRTESREFESHLQELEVNHIEHNKCKAYYKNKRNVKIYIPQGIREDVQICAGAVVGDSCDGDSGGPLQVENSNASYVYYVYDIVGIISSGIGCGLSAIPSVYTRVYNYIPWIERTVWPDEQ